MTKEVQILLQPLVLIIGKRLWKSYSLSITHHEAEMKWQQLQQPSTSNKLNSQLQNVQASRRCALLKQLKAIKCLLRQGIAVRDHTEIEGNLYQLLLMLANDSVDMKKWIHEGKYISHEIINEQMCKQLVTVNIDKNKIKFTILVFCYWR